MTNCLLYQVGSTAVHLYVREMMHTDVDFQAPLPEGAHIIAPNHPTTLDPFLITAFFPTRLHVLVTESAFKVPLFGDYLRRTGHIPVVAGEGRQAFDAARSLLLDGQTVAIFPEGALSPLGGGVGKPHTGVARLAMLTHAPVIPVGIAVRQDAIRFVRTGIRDAQGQEEIARVYLRAPYAVSVGAPLHINGDVEDWALVRATSANIMQRIAHLSRQSAARINVAATLDAQLETVEMAGLS